MSERTADQERLRFEGDLDKWMKIIGAGITGYQPEAYAVMDWACHELERLRSALKVAADHAEGAFDDRPRARSESADWNDGYLDGTRAAAAAIRQLLSSPTPSEIGWRQRQGGSE